MLRNDTRIGQIRLIDTDFFVIQKETKNQRKSVVSAQSVAHFSRS